MILKRLVQHNLSHAKKMRIAMAVVVLISITSIVWQRDIEHFVHCHKDNCVKCTMIVIGDNIWNSLKHDSNAQDIGKILSIMILIILIESSFNLLKRTPVLMKSRIDI